jgi:rSAM/selenodomain-associated transferase 1
MTPLVALFLHAPRSGAIKPRLASAIGDRQALRLYRVMVSRTLAAVRETGFDATIWFAPADAAVEMRRWLGEACDLRPQASGDLGSRLAAAEQAVMRGRGWLAITGDCPRLDGELLRVAAAIAARGEVALGPSEHGGCYLIGGRTPLPTALFEAGAWSASGVLAETRARLAQAGLAWRELPTLREVDTAEDAEAEGLLT